MGIARTKTIRYFLNLIIYAVILVFTTYYIYVYIPDLFIVKNLLLPLGGAIVISIMLAMVLATINEIITAIVVKVSRRN